MYRYHCKGTCSNSIDLEIRQGIITACQINGGCRGNTQGVARLAVGRPAEEVARMLEGIQCRGGTSCPDQLSKAIRSYQDEATES